MNKWVKPKISKSSIFNITAALLIAVDAFMIKGFEVCFTDRETDIIRTN